MGIATPCINICVINEEAGLCEGCGRTLDEVASWTKFSKEERSEIMTSLPERLAKLESKANAPSSLEAEAVE